MIYQLSFVSVLEKIEEMFANRLSQKLFQNYEIDFFTTMLHLTQIYLCISFLLGWRDIQS